MRSLSMLSLATAALVAALAVGVQAPAFASPAVTSSQCQQLQGLLTSADLCVSVQATSSTVQPGSTAGFVVDVSVEGGSTAAVTVTLSASSGAADITGGCPDGDGTGQCWIATMGILGSPASYALDVSAPGGAAGSAVSLSATASVPTLLPWTPPSAGTSVAVASPKPSRSKSTSSSSSPSSSSPSPGRSSGAAPAPGRSPAGHPSPGTSTSVGAVGAVGFTGSFPTLGTTGTPLTQAGNATGMFPAIGPSASPGSGTVPRVGAVPDAYRSGLPLAPLGLVVALVMGAAWFALAGLGPFRRWRAGRKA